MVHESVRRTLLFYWFSIMPWHEEIFSKCEESRGGFCVAGESDWENGFGRAYG